MEDIKILIALNFLINEFKIAPKNEVKKVLSEHNNKVDIILSHT